MKANKILRAVVTGAFIFGTLAMNAQQKITGPVSIYGELKICYINGKGRLCGSKSDYINKALQVRGVSLFWCNWAGKFYIESTVENMANGWKAEVIRAALGYSESGGYQSSPALNKNRIKTVVEAAIAQDIYVIIDWHSHNAHAETAAAKAFFSEMAETYGSYDHVIFEIYNEPTPENGGTWANIKKYADEIIAAIREHSDNLILVGTPNWCQIVDAGLSDPIIENIAYVAHFYAGGAPDPSFQARITNVLNVGYPVFVSEYGTTHYDGGNPDANNYNTHNAANSDAWHTFMDNNKISSCAWSVFDKYEGSAFFGLPGNNNQGNTFNPATATAADWVNTSKMTPSGQYIYNKLVAYAADAEWRNVPSTSILDKPISGNNLFFANSNLNLYLTGSTTLSVFNLFGNKVVSVNLTDGVHAVSFIDLPEGIYFAVAASDSWKQTLKFMR